MTGMTMNGDGVPPNYEETHLPSVQVPDELVEVLVEPHPHPAIRDDNAAAARPLRSDWPGTGCASIRRRVRVRASRGVLRP